MFISLASILCLAIIGYLVRKLFYDPYLARLHMLKHPNVYVSPNYSPGRGDIEAVLRSLNEEGATYLTTFNRALSQRPYDLVHLSFGPYLLNGVVSVKAVEDLSRLVPSHIDRSPHEKRTIGQMFSNWFGLLPSDKV